MVSALTFGLSSPGSNRPGTCFVSQEKKRIVRKTLFYHDKFVGSFVLGRDTLLSCCLSPLRSING